MTNFNNQDLYLMLLNRLRKDRKGSVSPEEFESFLRWRNLDYSNLMLKSEGVDKRNETSLAPLLSPYKPIVVTFNAATGRYSGDITLLNPAYAYWKNLWIIQDEAEDISGVYDMTGMTPVDIVSGLELPDRLTNAITGPSTDHPVGEFTNETVYVHGIDADGIAILSYYKLPADPYYDYYTDAYGNVTYLPDTTPATTHLLSAGEISRSGATSGEITSESVDLEWDDDDAINILDMIVSDVSIALSDPGSFQASLLEREKNN